MTQAQALITCVENVDGYTVDPSLLMLYLLLGY